jgi:hypothetical protein
MAAAQVVVGVSVVVLLLSWLLQPYLLAALDASTLKVTGGAHSMLTLAV